MTKKTDNFVKERWIYTGRRLVGNGKLAHSWRDESGEKLLYKSKHKLVGGLYEVEVERSIDATRASLESASFVEAAAGTESERQEWEVLDKAAYATDLARKAEDKARRERNTWESMTLSDLRENFQKLPAGQQAAMTATVTSYLYGGV